MDNNLLTKKLELFKEYYDKINRLIVEETDVLSQDELKYHTLERLFQLLVDCSVDINIHLLKEKTGKVPDDLQSTFIELGNAKMLDEKFAKKMAPVVGLRNRIVHRYDTLNNKDFINLLKSNLADFDQYFNIVRKLLLG